MRLTMFPSVIAVAAAVTACGGAAAPTASPGGGAGPDDLMAKGAGAPADPDSVYGPLEVGADYATYTKVNTAAFESPTHGGRTADVWVNAVGLAAYQDETAEIPVGTVIVKTTFERDGAAGPIFVMEKRAAGSNPDHNDWWYAIHWEAPTEAWAKRLGGPLYWRTPSPKAAYCFDCHEGYDRELGGVPAEQRAW